MKLYYIDDSMFQSSSFSSQILFRFERYVQAHKGDVVLISAANDKNIDIENFCKIMPQINILMSPSIFDVQGVRGNLHSTFLAVEDFAIMQSFSGSFVEYDTDTKKCKRIYLELFIDHDPEVDWIVQEMEQMLSGKVMEMKKKTILS